MKCIRLVAMGVCSLIAFNPGIGLAHNHSDSNDHKNHGKVMNMNEGNRKKIDNDTKSKLLKVFEYNQELHESFFSYDKANVVKNAKKTAKAISNIEDPELRKTLTYSQEVMNNMTTKMSEEELKSNYHTVSMALIHVLTNYDLGGSYNGFSCPMVKKKWVQNTSKNKEARNPYASNMKSCGSQDTRF